MTGLNGDANKNSPILLSMHQENNMDEMIIYPPNGNNNDANSSDMCPSSEGTIANINNDSSSIINGDVSQINLTNDDSRCYIFVFCP